MAYGRKRADHHYLEKHGATRPRSLLKHLVALVLGRGERGVFLRPALEHTRTNKGSHTHMETLTQTQWNSQTCLHSYSLSLRLSISLTISEISLCLSIHLYVSQHISLSLCLSTYLSISISFSLSIWYILSLPPNILSSRAPCLSPHLSSSCAPSLSPSLSLCLPAARPPSPPLSLALSSLRHSKVCRAGPADLERPGVFHSLPRDVPTSRWHLLGTAA